MAITTIDGIVDGLGNAAQLLQINKGSIISQLSGGFSALWRATGTPGQGAIPGAAAVCTGALLGAMAFVAPTTGKSSYLARGFLMSGNTVTDVDVHDRLAHMGGLSGTVITAQTVSVDVAGTGNNMVARRGAADYSDVEWWLEWYTATGATAATATVTYTNAAGTAGRTTTVALTASMGASRRLPILGASGEFIQSVQSVTLSVSTGTAGSFGVTASRYRTNVSLGLANAGQVSDWQMLGLPKIDDEACLELLVIPNAGNTGALYGAMTLIQG